MLILLDDKGWGGYTTNNPISLLHLFLNWNDALLASLNSIIEVEIPLLKIRSKTTLYAYIIKKQRNIMSFFHFSGGQILSKGFICFVLKDFALSFLSIHSKFAS